MNAPARPRWFAPVLVSVLVFTLGVGVWWLWPSGTSTPAASGSPTMTGSTMTQATATSSAAPTPTSTTSSSAPTGAMVAAPVFYVADVPDFGPRLYREFHRVPLLGGDPVLTSLTQMLRGNPADPDYSSPWPVDTTVRSVSTNGTTATVDLSGFVGLGAAFESAAVQQLVYTVTAANPAVRTVRLRVNGTVPPSGHSDWSAPIARADPLDIQAHVWILDPTQGATVRSPVTVKVLGTGWEGNVPLKVYRGSTVVAEGFVTTMMGGFAEAQRAFTLAPGGYEIRAYNDNGKDSSLDLWDSKAFTVR